MYILHLYTFFSRQLFASLYAIFRVLGSAHACRSHVMYSR